MSRKASTGYNGVSDQNEDLLGCTSGRKRRRGVKILKLPELFLNEIESLLGNEKQAFLDQYNQPPHSGLRVNRLKISVADFLKISPFKLRPIPWTGDGFYYDEADRPAKHPYYHAGLFYLQEPSAMAPVSVLDPRSGDKVLDLCACPGGKTLQIASALGGTGVIVANDISTSRIKALIRNIEMAGVTNALVLNENEAALGQRFAGVFDKVLVDAPCSGEGMFRKDSKAVAAWSAHSPGHYRLLQDNLLDQAGIMLKSGGRLAYSTCTFNRLENEFALEAFMQRFPEFTRATPNPSLGLDQRTGFGRLWPHLHGGEGHFAGLLEKSADGYDSPPMIAETRQTDATASFRAFEKESLLTAMEGSFLRIQDRLYLMPVGLPSTERLRVIRSGWYLGEEKNGRFIPSGALAMGLKPEQVKRVIRLEVDQFEVIRYLKGETISVDGEDGMNLVCLGHFPLGWGKLNQGVLKNQYPPAWRML